MIPNLSRIIKAKNIQFENSVQSEQNDSEKLATLLEYTKHTSEIIIKYLEKIEKQQEDILKIFVKMTKE